MTNTRGMFICFVNVVSAERLEGKLSLSIKGRNKLTSQGIQGLMSSVTKQQNGIQCHPKQARKARRCNLQSETMNHCIDSLTHPLTDRGRQSAMWDSTVCWCLWKAGIIVCPDANHLSTSYNISAPSVDKEKYELNLIVDAATFVCGKACIRRKLDFIGDFVIALHWQRCLSLFVMS